MKSLTASQRQLAEDNHDLINYTLNKLGWSIDEWYDSAAIGLCKAALNFDASKGYAFSTYAYNAIKYTVLHEISRRYSATKVPENEITRLDEIVTDDGKEQSELIGGEVDVEESAVANIVVSRFIESLTPRDAKIIRMRMHGFINREIGSEVKISGSFVQHRVSEIRKAYTKQFGTT